MIPPKGSSAMSAILVERTVRPPESLPQGPLELGVEDLGCSVVVIHVRGEATCDLAADLNEQLRSSLSPGPQFVMLDLAGLSAVGPAALQTLAELARDVCRQGGEVWLTGLQPAVWLALHTARLERLFMIRASLAQALAS
jgi:anti-anti-sigma factor